VRIGLIGAGAIARRHVGVLSALDGVELVAVCDSDPARAESIAAGAAVCGSWPELLERPLDAVFVCTPPAAHAEPAIAALQQGLAVYLEKPLARSAADGETIAAAWRESGGVCAVGYQWRSLALLGRVFDELAGVAPGMLVSRVNVDGWTRSTRPRPNNTHSETASAVTATAAIAIQPRAPMRPAPRGGPACASSSRSFRRSIAL